MRVWGGECEGVGWACVGVGGVCKCVEGVECGEGRVRV